MKSDANTPEGQWCFGPDQSSTSNLHEVTDSALRYATLMACIRRTWFVGDGMLEQDLFELVAVEFWPIVRSDILDATSGASCALSDHRAKEGVYCGGYMGDGFQQSRPFLA